MNAEDIDRLMDLLRTEGDDEFAHRVLDGVATKRSNEVAELMLNEALEKVRIAEAVRDDARMASLADLERRRAAESSKGVDTEGATELVVYATKRGWAKGVQACIDMVKRRHEHYKQYKCDCETTEPSNERGPGSRLSGGHRPGCKGEMMQTRPATLAAYDEMFVFLSAMLLRGEKP